ncbi:xylose isomerase-like protein [Xylariaceae sp. FL0804]|nr:xylose isomerase-like protein [Xylariaceae sp. FL0804]
MPRQSPRKTRTATSVTDGKGQPEPKARVSSRETARSKVVPEAGAASPAKKRGTVKTEAEEEVEEKPTQGQESKRKRKVVKVEVEEEALVDEAKPAKKRKSAKAKVDDTMPLVERTAVASMGKAMYIGAHVSSAGGVQNSITNAVHIGANAFALFLKSQRKWANPPMAPEARDGFHRLSREHKFETHSHCLPHGSYLVNLAQAEKDKADQAFGAFLDDLQRCESLGIRLYNFHPGNTNGDTRESAIGRIAAQLNKSHKATSSVVTVLETMAGQGNVVGSTFEDLRDIIAQVDDKSRVGVCIDTCHVFAAGYDLRTPAAFADTMARFDAVVGTAAYLRALHLNDSKAPLGSRRDLHANVGTGFLGLRAFHSVVNWDGFAGLPMVLETPIDRKGADGKAFEDKQVWADEIKLLESLVGMDADGDAFAALAAELQARGAGERDKIQDQVDRKSAKDAKKGDAKKGGAKKGAAAKKRGRKQAADSSDDEAPSE